MGPVTEAKDRVQVSNRLPGPVTKATVTVHVEQEAVGARNRGHRYSTSGAGGCRAREQRPQV